MDQQQFIDVLQVDETSDIHAVNEMLKLGWKLLKIRNEKDSETEYTVFVLGLPTCLSDSRTKPTLKTDQT